LRRARLTLSLAEPDQAGHPKTPELNASSSSPKARASR
jgi:hypothetical protein